jgi:hypothetical protein
LFWSFVIICLFLGWIGGKPIEYPFLQLGQLITFLYFLYFFVLLSVSNSVEWFFYRQTQEIDVSLVSFPFSNNKSNNSVISLRSPNCFIS